MSEYANYDDYNDPFDENEEEDGKKLTAGKIIGKTIRYTLRILALLVFVILFWRIFSGNDPKAMQKFIWTEEAAKSYASSPNDFKAYYYKHKDNLAKDGTFAASSVYYVPENGEIQFTVRYNDSTLEKVAEHYSLSELTEGELFVFTLTDSNGNTYTEYEYITDKKNMYNYRRLIFKGVDINSLIIENPPSDASEEEIEAVNKKKQETYIVLNVYYKDKVLLSEPYAKLSVFDYSYYHEPMDMNKYAKKGAEITAGLNIRPDYTVIPEPDETE